MKKYIFSKYDETFGCGNEQVFTSESEAVKTAEAEWRNMCHADKKRYLGNPISEFRVFEIEIENEAEIEELREYGIFEDVETENIWNACIEKIVEFRPSICHEWQTVERIKGIDEIENFDFFTFLENEIEFLPDGCENAEIGERYEYYNYVCRDIVFTDENEKKQVYEFRTSVQEIY